MAGTERIDSKVYVIEEDADAVRVFEDQQDAWCCYGGQVGGWEGAMEDIVNSGKLMSVGEAPRPDPPRVLWSARASLLVVSWR
jgi:hypothetical protein